MCLYLCLSASTIWASIMSHSSMGGAIATRTAASEVIKSLVGLAVIDVVEGGCVCVCIVCVCYLWTDHGFQVPKYRVMA